MLYVPWRSLPSGGNIRTHPPRRIVPAACVSRRIPPPPLVSASWSAQYPRPLIRRQRDDGYGAHAPPVASDDPAAAQVVVVAGVSTCGRPLATQGQHEDDDGGTLDDSRSEREVRGARCEVRSVGCGYWTTPPDLHVYSLVRLRTK